MKKVFVISLGLLFFSAGLVRADVPGSQEALKHMDATLAAVESAAKYAQQGHAEAAILYAQCKDFLCR